MRVASNAGPLIALGKLGQLGLLRKLYAEILIPREVYNEVVINGLRLGAPEAQAVDYLVRQGVIQVLGVSVPAPLPEWARPIDLGEIEAIVLAQTQAADLVLIDNAHGRRAARAAGVDVQGTIGLLLAALRQNHITLADFELLIQNIKAQPDLWISDHLCDLALEQARRLR